MQCLRAPNQGSENHSNASRIAGESINDRTSITLTLCISWHHPNTLHIVASILPHQHHPNTLHIVASHQHHPNTLHIVASCLAVMAVCFRSSSTNPNPNSHLAVVGHDRFLQLPILQVAVIVRIDVHECSQDLRQGKGLGVRGRGAGKCHNGNRARVACT